MGGIYRIECGSTHKQSDMVQGHDDHHNAPQQIDRLYPETVRILQIILFQIASNLAKEIESERSQTVGVRLKL